MYLEKKSLEKHKQVAKHDFPSINTRDWLLLQASKPGGAIASGSRPNRCTKSLSGAIISAEPGLPSEMKARCYQQFNRRDKYISVPKTDAQICFLLVCFGAPTKMNDKQTRDKMISEIDPVDDGLKFCSSKSHMQTNGSVLTADQIT